MSGVTFIPRPITRHGWHYLLCGLLVAGGSGCGHAVQTAKKPDERLEFSFSAPDVYASERIQHEFVLVNPKGLDLHTSQQAISTSCKCTDVKVANDWSANGKQTVTVTVQTDDRESDFSEKADIQWMSDDGGLITTSFVINAHVLPVLRVAPTAIGFSPDDVKVKRKKAIRFSSPLSVDWSTFKCLSESKGFELGNIERLQEEAVCELLPTFEADAGALTQDDLVFQVCVSQDSLRLPGKALSIKVPCSAMREVEIDVAPRVIALQRDEKANLWRGRVFIRGTMVNDLARSGFSVECDGFEVKHTVRVMREGVLLVDFALSTLSSQVSAPSKVRVCTGTPKRVLAECGVVPIRSSQHQ